MAFAFLAGCAASTIGVGVGAAAGLTVGPYIFNRLKPADYKHLSENADHDDTVPAPRHGMLVQSDLREALDYMEPWIQDPGFDRVSMINRLMATVWPTMTRAVLNMVLTGDMYNQMIFPQLNEQVFKKYAFVEDLLLGELSLRHGRAGSEAWLKGKEFTLGTAAPRMGGFKIVPTADDEVLLETVMMWGSDAVLDVSAVLRFGGVRIVVPLHLGKFNIKADVRIALRPLVDKIPILGGVTIHLMRVPTVDCELMLFKSIDIMALPGLPALLNFGMRLVMEPMTLPGMSAPVVPGMGMLYPNGMSFPIMPNFGVPPPPRGAVKVSVLRLEGVKGGNDLYCTLEVRRGRFQQTRTVANQTSPEFNEDFALIVDSFENDLLRISVWNDDMSFSDTLLSIVEIPFGEVIGSKPDPKDPTKEISDFQEADFVRNPAGERVALPLCKPPRTGGALRAGSRAASKVFKGAKSVSGGAFSRIFSRKETKSPASSTGGAAPGLAGSPTLATSPSGLYNDIGAVEVKDRGTIHLKIQFIPFFEPSFDDEVREKAERESSKKKDPRMNMFPPPPGRAMGGLGGAVRGVLTVTLMRCADLAPEGAKDMATYVKMLVTNEEKDETQTSSTILNETSPRWGDKFDFVLIPAASSELHITVYNKASMLSNVVGSLTSVFKAKKEEADICMGKLLIPVKDVARNGRLQDVWALQDVDRGHIELQLTWQTCFVSDV